MRICSEKVDFPGTFQYNESCLMSALQVACAAMLQRRGEGKIWKFA